MSLYNQLFGVNPWAGILLQLLGTTHHHIPRFRDCFLNEAGEVVIYTRTGGGNREDYVDENEALRKLPGFLGDEDDSMDCTYAHFRYAIPEALKPSLSQLKELGAVADPAERFKTLLAKLGDKGNQSDPDVQHAMEVGKRILDPIMEAFKKGDK